MTQVSSMEAELVPYSGLGTVPAEVLIIICRRSAQRPTQTYPAQANLASWPQCPRIL